MIFGVLNQKVRWANVHAIDVRFSQDLAHQKSLKSVLGGCFYAAPCMKLDHQVDVLNPWQ